MEALCCPLCSIPLEPSGLEAHLRYELRYPLAACSLCPMTFCGEAEADEHFVGPLAKHPGVEPQLIGHPSDAVKRARLMELLRLARGGEEAVQQRLCVCGQCQLMCRGDFHPTPLSVERPRRFRVKKSPDSDMQTSAERYDHHRAEDSPDPAFRFATDLGPPLKPAQFGLPGPDAARDLADESEPSELSDRGDRENQLSRDEEIPTHQTWQTSEEEAQIAVQRQQQPKNTIAKTKPNPKPSVAKAPVLRKKQSLKNPQTKKASLAKKDLRCRSCDKSVRSWDVKEHASRFHLNKPLYECKLCDYANSNSNVGKINVHVKSAHGKTPGPETVDSSGLQRYAPAIKALIQELFDL